jgi:hypothetical protein
MRRLPAIPGMGTPEDANPCWVQRHRWDSETGGQEHGAAEPPVRSSMKRLDAANDNDATKQIARTRQIWQPRIGRDLSDEAARQIRHNVTGFFGVLADWSRAERLAAANDEAAPAARGESEARHDG